jgi:hypothetical protein
MDDGNGLRFCVTNAQIICRSKNGHCHIWTVAEGKMMAGILIVYIRVIISWEITCVFFNLGGTRASVAFFDALDVELGTLSPAHRAFVRVEKAGTHVSNLEWRRPNVWSTSEDQIQTVSKSVKKTGCFLRRLFLDVVSPNCTILRGIAKPRAPSFFDTLVEDNLRARYVQNISFMEYYDRLKELAGFYRDQRWMHMHAVLRDRDINFHELGHRGCEAALASLEVQGFSRKEASTEFGHRGRDGALASLEAQGFTGEGAASTELASRSGEARWGGEARIHMKSGSCIYPGCPYSISSYEFCKNHHPHKPIVEKSDKCRVCGRVLAVDTIVRGGVCNACYYKPETVAMRKKATAAKKAARGT